MFVDGDPWFSFSSGFRKMCDGSAEEGYGKFSTGDAAHKENEDSVSTSTT